MTEIRFNSEDVYNNENYVDYQFNGQEVTSSDFSGVNFSDAVFDDCYFKNCIFNYVKTIGTRFNNCRFEGCTFQDSEMSKVSFIDCNLINTDMSSTNLTNSVFKQSVLTNVSFQSANLTLSCLTDIDLSTCDIRFCTGNMVEIKSMQLEIWQITFTKDILAVGCKQRKLSVWKKYSDSNMNMLQTDALKYFLRWKDFILKAHEMTFEGV